jgi:hypothetical protein
MRCRKCGYFEDVHEDAKCPVCQCGETPSVHVLAPNGKAYLCPAFCMLCASMTPVGEPHEHRPYRLGKEGEPLSLRRGTFEQASSGPFPIEARVARILSCITIDLPPIAQAEPLAEPDEWVPHRPPQVRARSPLGPGEFAGYGGRQAVGLGRRGVLNGWGPTPLYWRSADGVEGCGVWLSKDPMRAVATWKRPAGKLGSKSGWGADIAYAWRTDSGTFPVKLTHTELEGLLL